MILPNEINKKVRSGQIMHRTISGCLAVAGQLPLFLEALLIRHGLVLHLMVSIDLQCYVFFTAMALNPWIMLS